MADIDKDQLKALPLDPRNGVKEISAALGMSDATFYLTLDREPELKKIYQDARDEMRANKNADAGRKPRTSTTKTGKRKTASAAKPKPLPPPPAMAMPRAA